MSGVTQLLQDKGMCGVLNGDGSRACILPLEHDGRHGWEQEDELVVLPRAALFEFFGQMALPPWKDERGRTIGERIDCAPIAQQISEWIDAHDMSRHVRVIHDEPETTT